MSVKTSLATRNPTPTLPVHGEGEILPPPIHGGIEGGFNAYLYALGCSPLKLCFQSVISDRNLSILFVL